MSKAKGQRTVRKAIKFFEQKGYLIDKVELGGRYTKEKDLFSKVCDGFDLIGIKPNELILIQVKTNNPPIQKTYKKFAKKYANEVIKVVCATYYDYKGWRLQWYDNEGNITEEDLRD